MEVRIDLFAYRLERTCGSSGYVFAYLGENERDRGKGSVIFLRIPSSLPETLLHIKCENSSLQKLLTGQEMHPEIQLKALSPST